MREMVTSCADFVALRELRGTAGVAQSSRATTRAHTIDAARDSRAAVEQTTWISG
jgi:hypothetical protein